MINLIREANHRCILQKNVSSDKIIQSYLDVVSSSKTKVDYDEVKKELKNRNLYRGRSDSGSISTMGVRFSQMCFYMFGYKIDKIFIPSPMTENILNSSSKISKESNMLVNLFSMQFPHPYSKTPKEFNIYFGRLIIKLLLDERIGKKLYIDEFIYFLPFIDKIDENKYEELIDSILEFRTYSYYQKLNLFKSIHNYQEFMATTLHEFKYYFLGIFEGFGVVDLIQDEDHNDGKIITFYHPVLKEGTKPTPRYDNIDGPNKCSGYFRLNANVVEDAVKLNSNFSAFDKPTTMGTEGINSLRDWLTALYDTEPLGYLNSISNEVNRNKEISDIIQNMVYASKYGSRDGKDFEDALEPFMNLFRETCNVEIISGAGNTDLLCAMEDINADIYKMNVDAKTRKAGLEAVIASRLENHIRRHGAKFCIVVAPRFASGVAGDIAGHKIVTVRADDFGSYAYKECKNSSDGFADFESIHQIIESNYGTDITEHIRNLTTSRYGISI